MLIVLRVVNYFSPGN